jgi:serine phosphatase RsbU (regulator of sigma subunit)/streptogramin lyase
MVSNPDWPGGLPNNNIFSICEDLQGNLWMGTRSGLSRYDPLSGAFTSMGMIPGNPNSMADNVAFSLYYDPDDDILWVGTWGNGLNILDRNARQVVNFQNNPDRSNSLSDNDVFSLYEDREGIVWIGTEGGGLNRYDPSDGTFKNYMPEPDNLQSISNDEVMCIHQDRSGKIWLGTYGGGLNIFDPVKETFELYKGNPGSPFNNKTILTITEDSKGFLWLTTGHEGVVRINPGTGESTAYQYSPGNTDAQIFNEVLAIIEDQTGAIWFGSRNNGLTRLDPVTGDFTFYRHDPGDPNSLGSNAIYAIHEDTRGNLWIGTRGSGINILQIPPGVKPVFEKITTRDGLFNDWITGIEEDRQGNIWASGAGLSKISAINRQVHTYHFSETNQGAFHKGQLTGLFYLGSTGFDIFHPDSIKDIKEEPPIMVSNLSRYETDNPSGLPVQVSGIFTYDSLTISYREKLLTFEFVSLDYNAGGERKYAYLLENFNNEWIQLGSERKITITGLSPGKYDLRVKSVSPNGQFSRNEANLSLTVLPPWWRSRLAYAAYLLFFFLALGGYIRLRTRKLKKDKEVLESMVVMRTREIAEQKDEIETQRDQLEMQRDLVMKQKSEIIDSISYAQRIQAAMLPPESYVNELLNENFILFRPKNIVSGDFYWAKLVSQKTILVVADCTGHGVPGAFMSMLGISFLDEIVARRGITHAHLILNEVRYLVKHSLRQVGRPDESKDSIDMAICVLDESNKTLQFAGANCPLYIIREENGSPEMMEIKPDRMPLGYYLGIDRPFTKHEIQLKIGDAFYMFSDGYPDQKGGEHKKKFMIKNFKKLLLSIHEQSMYEQKITLEKTLDDWKNGSEQIDDILVMGVRLQ